LQVGGDATTFTELSPKSRYEKTSKMINLVKKNRQYKREQFEHQKKNYQQQLFENKIKMGEVNQKIKVVDDENELLKNQVDQMYQLTGVIRNQLNNSPPLIPMAIEYRSIEMPESYSQTLNVPTLKN